MAAKKPKRGLGRGIDALLNPGGAARAEQLLNPENLGAETLRNLPIEVIQKGRFQPRLAIAEEPLEDLANSIRTQGVVQPIVVRPLAAGGYEIIAGERRWRASQLAGLGEIPAVIRDVPDNAALAIALIENIQREDLNPLEEALALRRLQHEFDLTHQQVAEAVGRSRTAVTNLLRLLDLSDGVQAMLADGRVDMGHARALLALDPMLQLEAAQQILVRGLSVRETEQMVRRLQASGSRPGATKAGSKDARIDPNIRELRDDLAGRLGAKIAIQHSPTGKGRLVIDYNSLDELDGILAHIK